jgi:hypothetical protein
LLRGRPIVEIDPFADAEVSNRIYLDKFVFCRQQAAPDFLSDGFLKFVEANEQFN